MWGGEGNDSQLNRLYVQVCTRYSIKILFIVGAIQLGNDSLFLSIENISGAVLRKRCTNLKGNIEDSV
jgi:hypothetical protein